MSGVFISYRRQDSQSAAGRLADHLKENLRAPVFRDVETIEPGVDFVEAIEKALASCAVMLVVIGPRWISISDASGRRRVDDESDYTRLEVGTALKRNVRVIPVLVEGAVMPGDNELPEDLKPLARRNAIELSDKRWEYDVSQLVETLHKALGDVGVAGTPIERVKQVLTEPERMTEELAKTMGFPAGKKPFFAAGAGKPASSRRRLWIGVGFALMAILVVALMDHKNLSGVWADANGARYQVIQEGDRISMKWPWPGDTMVAEGVVMGHEVQVNYMLAGHRMVAHLQVAADARRMDGTITDEDTGAPFPLVLYRQ